MLTKVMHDYSNGVADEVATINAIDLYCSLGLVTDDDADKVMPSFRREIPSAITTQLIHASDHLTKAIRLCRSGELSPFGLAAEVCQDYTFSRLTEQDANAIIRGIPYLIR